MKNKLREEFYENGRFDSLPVYDMHGHMGNTYGIHLPYTDTDRMVSYMDRSGVKMLVFCHHAALTSPETGNRVNIEAVRKYPERLRAYCGINPNYTGVTEKDLKEFDGYYKQKIYAGFKFFSSYHKTALSDEAYRPVWEFADARGLPVLLHTWGGDVFNGPVPLRKMAEKYQRVKILMGHSCHGEWDKAIALVKDFPNLYLELCAVLDERGILEKMVDEAGDERIFFGTDLPWFSYNYYIGAVLGADIPEESMVKILSSNAEKLLAAQP